MTDDPRVDPDESARTPEETEGAEEDHDLVASSDPDSPGLAATVVEHPERNKRG